MILLLSTPNPERVMSLTGAVQFLFGDRWGASRLGTGSDQSNSDAGEEREYRPYIWECDQEIFWTGGVLLNPKPRSIHTLH